MFRAAMSAASFVFSVVSWEEVFDAGVAVGEKLLRVFSAFPLETSTRAEAGSWYAALSSAWVQARVSR